MTAEDFLKAFLPYQAAGLPGATPSPTPSTGSGVGASPFSGPLGWVRSQAPNPVAPMPAVAPTTTQPAPAAPTPPPPNLYATNPFGTPQSQTPPQQAGLGGYMQALQKLMPGVGGLGALGHLFGGGSGTPMTTPEFSTASPANPFTSTAGGGQFGF